MNSCEEIIPLNVNVGNIQRDNQIRPFFNQDTIIQTINRMGSSGNVILSVATLDGFNQMVQIFFTNSAFQSLGNASHQLAPYNASKMDELNRLLLENSNLFHSQEENLDVDDDDDDYIEWSLFGDNLIKKRKEFREQIDLYKTYDNQYQSITRLLMEIIDYYIKEYLVEEKQFSTDEIKQLEHYFQQAINEKNYLKYFIKAYTSNNKFHRVLNKHLALYILDYFDLYTYTVVPRGYRLINCLVYIVTLLINHPDIYKYQYKGTAYRSLLMTENALEHYNIGNHILNRSFVSTTKNLAIAQMFTCNDQQNVLEQNSNECGLKKVSVLLKYTIKQDQTAIDIAQLSVIPDEEEVLILPFSVFQVKDRKESCSNICSSKLIEIDLEECENDEQKNTKEQEGNLGLKV
jgi:hypothetical protein